MLPRRSRVPQREEGSGRGVSARSGRVKRERGQPMAAAPRSSPAGVKAEGTAVPWRGQSRQRLGGEHRLSVGRSSALVLSTEKGRDPIFPFLPGCQKKWQGVRVSGCAKKGASKEYPERQAAPCSTKTHPGNQGAICTVMVGYSLRTHVCARFSSSRFTPIKTSLCWAKRRPGSKNTGRAHPVLSGNPDSPACCAVDAPWFRPCGSMYPRMGFLVQISLTVLSKKNLSLSELQEKIRFFP